MIIGIGSDITHISRFERSLNAYGRRLLERILGEDELKELQSKKHLGAQEYAAFVSRRFAAKEACSKALGTGFRNGIYLKDIQTVHNMLGKPELKLSGAAAAQFEKISQGGTAKIHLSVSDDYPLAQAVVIIELI